MLEPKVCVILHNIRSIYNVGAILRTAEGLGIDEVIYSGYTPRYEDKALLPHLREKLNRQIEKSALGAEKIVKQSGIEANLGDFSGSEQDFSDSRRDFGPKCLTNFIKCATMERWTIVGLENNLSEDEIPRRRLLGEARNSTDFGEKIVLILGEEVGGIPADIREMVDFFLEIPMVGQKESFNVSVATGIALWALKNRAEVKF